MLFGLLPRCGDYSCRDRAPLLEGCAEDPSSSRCSGSLDGRSSCCSADTLDHVPVTKAAFDDQRLLQEALGAFVRTLVRGMHVEVLLDDGSVIIPQASLNYELTHLMLKVNEMQRMIALEDVETVATPTELKGRGLHTLILPYLDERCCTLVVRNCQFLTFRLDNVRHREYFAACLAFLINRCSSGGPGVGPPSAAGLAAQPLFPEPEALPAGDVPGHAADAADVAAPGTMPIPEPDC